MGGTRTEAKTGQYNFGPFLPAYAPVRSQSDRKWDELFASTTPDEFARLERLFNEDDDEEDTPLKFSNR